LNFQLCCNTGLPFILFYPTITKHLVQRGPHHHLPLSEVDCGFVQALVGETKDNKIGICGFSAKHAALRSKKKDLSACNQKNVSEWSDMQQVLVIHVLVYSI
jgi:hypothetical protein